MSRKTVAKLMRSNGIVGISPRAGPRSRPGPTWLRQPSPDLVGRRFDQGELNRVWTSDITYLATGQGWLYLCAVRDGCSRRVLGWSVQDHLRADLVDQALTMAVVLRGSLPDKVIFHADRGTQVHLAARSPTLCAGLGLLQSVGRTGVCWDNAAAESFWSTLKTEFYNRHNWPTKAEARLAVGRWIEERYNRRRRHSAHRHDDPRPVRTPSTDGYPGRLIACPPDGVSPSQAACVVWVWNSSNRTGLIIPTEECRLSRLCG